MRRTLLVFALATSLVATGSNRGFFRQLWDGLAAAWGLSATADEGCGMDPYGGCAPAPQPDADAGCGVDPNGCPKGS